MVLIETVSQVFNKKGGIGKKMNFYPSSRCAATNEVLKYFKTCKNIDFHFVIDFSFPKGLSHQLLHIFSANSKSWTPTKNKKKPNHFTRRNNFWRNSTVRNYLFTKENKLNKQNEGMAQCSSLIVKYLKDKVYLKIIFADGRL